MTNRESQPLTKVSFLTNGKHTPSSRFRVEQFIDKINDEFDYKVRPGGFQSESSFSTAFNAARAVNRAREIVFDGSLGRRFFIQRMLLYRNSIMLERLLFATAKDGVIVDFDDAIFLKNPKFAYTVRHADLVIAGNKFLAEWAASLNTNVKVIPTCVDHDRYAVERDSSFGSNRRVRIGWTGTKGNLVYLEPLAAVLRELRRKHDFQFVLIADIDEPPSFLKSIPVEVLRWDRAKEIEQLAEIDIGLMPLPDTDWARGKCGFKLLQYMATGAVAVGSAIGSNTEIIMHGENGLLCKSSDEWADHLDWVLQEHESSDVSRLIENARRTITDRYSVSANRESFVTAIREVR